MKQAKLFLRGQGSRSAGPWWPSRGRAHHSQGSLAPLHLTSCFLGTGTVTSCLASKLLPHDATLSCDLAQYFGDWSFLTRPCLSLLRTLSCGLCNPEIVPAVLWVQGLEPQLGPIYSTPHTGEEMLAHWSVLWGWLLMEAAVLDVQTSGDKLVPGSPQVLGQRTETGSAGKRGSCIGRAWSSLPGN